MAETFNPDIQFFKKEEQARRYFSKIAKSCQLLKAANGYFVDTSKQAVKEWPNKYTVISEK